MSAEELRSAAKRGDWPAYFRALREEKDRALRGEAELTAPGPERTSRDGWPDGFAVPRPAASLVKAAEGAGWATEVRYSRGSVVCQRKAPDGGMRRVVERRHVVVVRLWHAGRDLHAVAVWESLVESEKPSWKGDTARVWLGGQLPQEVGVKELTVKVKGEA